MQISKRKYLYVLIHLFGWLIFSLGALFSRPGQWTIDTKGEICLRQITLLIVLICVFYINYYILIPIFLLRRKLVIYFFTVVAIVVLFVALNKATARLFSTHHSGSSRITNVPMVLRPHNDIDTFVPSMIILMIGLGVVISLLQSWQNEIHRRENLEKEKVSTELDSLKAQINPHFFFNTLNTIHSYTAINTDVARNAISNLSKMMRYVLYESDSGQATLDHELAFIEEYVSLMRLRVTSKTTIRLDLPQSHSGAVIAPMIFMPFVENAFKHGVSSAAPSNIEIIATYDDIKNEVVLQVSNTIHNHLNKNLSHQGIGIHNTQRRLQLLYPGRHDLFINQISGKYVVKLTICL